MLRNIITKKTLMAVTVTTILTSTLSSLNVLASPQSLHKTFTKPGVGLEGKADGVSIPKAAQKPKKLSPCAELNCKDHVDPEGKAGGFFTPIAAPKKLSPCAEMNCKDHVDPEGKAGG